MAEFIEGVAVITVHVTDLQQARHFYRDVLELQELEFFDDYDYATFRVPHGPVLGLHQASPDDTGRPPGTVTGVFFQVADVERAADAVRQRGGEVTEPPTSQPWGMVTAVIADPDGNEYGIACPDR